jgi:N-methylhydantoinase B
MTPGSLPLSTEIFQEGIIIPPLKLYRAGALNEDVLHLILRNVRTPDERRGDLAAQRAAPRRLAFAGCANSWRRTVKRRC